MHNGIHLASPNAAARCSTSACSATPGSGLTLYGGAKVKVRRLASRTAAPTPIRIADNGAATSLDGIDLGVTGDLGRNEFMGSIDSHVCVDARPWTARGCMRRATFGTSDCAVQGTTANVRSFLDCGGHSGGIDDPAPSVREAVDYCGSCSIQSSRRRP